MNKSLIFVVVIVLAGFASIVFGSRQFSWWFVHGLMSASGLWIAIRVGYWLWKGAPSPNPYPKSGYEFWQESQQSPTRASSEGVEPGRLRDEA